MNMIIDSHQHVFWHGRDDTQLIADMDKLEIDLAWLLTWNIAPEEDEPSYHTVLNPEHFRADGTHAGIPLSDLIKARDRYPDRFALGYCPHPLAGDAAAAFESAYHIHGVRVCGEWKFRMLFDDPRCLNLFRKAGELGCPVVLHLDVPYLFDETTGESKYQSSWYGGTVDNLEIALKACPETNFIGHAPGFWREISGDAVRDPKIYPSGPIEKNGRLYDLFDRYPNLYADISAGSGEGAFRRDLEHGRDFAIRYADRLLFARDYYGSDWNDLLKSLNLPNEVHHKLAFKNALSLVPDVISDLDQNI